MSDPTANKALVAEFIDALLTEGELEAVDRYLAPGFVNHDPFPGFAPDREGMRQNALVFRQAFPDWHAGQQAHVAEGDLVAERFTARGTHQGELLGVPPPDARLAWRGSTSSASRTASWWSAGAAPTTWGSCSSSGSCRRCRPNAWEGCAMTEPSGREPGQRYDASQGLGSSAHETARRSISARSGPGSWSGASRAVASDWSSIRSAPGIWPRRCIVIAARMSTAVCQGAGVTGFGRVPRARRRAAGPG